MQLRLVYSLLKPAVRCAARFGVPLRTAVDLMRLAFCEVLAHEGLSTGEIAEKLGQTARHVRSLRQRLNGDFFSAETAVGSPREIEDSIAARPGTADEIADRFPDLERTAVDASLAALLKDGRIELATENRFRTGRKYVVLTSENFHHRVDALNHHLDTVYRATLERLVFDNKDSAMMKTVSFSASAAAVSEFLRRTEGDLRQRIAEMEEHAQFNGETSRFSVGLTLAPSVVGKDTKEVANPQSRSAGDGG